MTQKKYPDELRRYSTSPFTTADPIRLRRRHIRRLQGRLLRRRVGRSAELPIQGRTYPLVKDLDKVSMPPAVATAL